MREIKFRVWNIVEKGMFDITDSQWPLKTWVSRPDNFVVMQYTGLKDKDGKEIYEGDIVAEWRDKYRREGTKFTVEYHQTGFRGISSEGDKYGPFTKNLYINDRNPILEVVGNIYEPLKGGRASN
jgi:uncharacterized phage protein (TIGR01671 family)